MNTLFVLAIVFLIAQFTTVVAVYASLSSKDSANNSKLLLATILISILASFTGFLLAMKYFSYNIEYMAIFLLALVMLVCLPGSLISIAISTITVSNLRDAKASGK